MQNLIYVYTYVKFFTLISYEHKALGVKNILKKLILHLLFLHLNKAT